MITKKRPINFHGVPLKWSTKKGTPELVRQQWGYTAQKTSYYNSNSISQDIWRGRLSVKTGRLHNFCDGHRITFPLDASRER